MQLIPDDITTIEFNHDGQALLFAGEVHTITYSRPQVGYIHQWVLFMERRNRWQCDDFGSLCRTGRGTWRKVKNDS